MESYVKYEVAYKFYLAPVRSCKYIVRDVYLEEQNICYLDTLSRLYVEMLYVK